MPHDASLESTQDKYHTKFTSHTSITSLDSLPATHDPHRMLLVVRHVQRGDDFSRSQALASECTDAHPESDGAQRSISLQQRNTTRNSRPCRDQATSHITQCSQQAQHLTLRVTQFSQPRQTYRPYSGSLLNSDTKSIPTPLTRNNGSHRILSR